MIIENIKIMELDKHYKRGINCIFKKCNFKDECILAFGFDKNNIIGRAFKFKKKNKVFYCDIEIFSEDIACQLEPGNMSIYPSIVLDSTKKKIKKDITYVYDGMIDYIGIGCIPHVDPELTGNIVHRVLDK